MSEVTATATKEQMEQALLEKDSFDLLDFFEEDPARRIQQVQQVRIHLLKTNPNSLDKEQLKVLDQLSKTDLTVMRMDVDKDSSGSLKELAGAVGEFLARQTTSPYRTIEGATYDTSAVPKIELGELGEEEVPDWALSEELGSPEYDDIMATEKSEKE